jgi:hypothetical protein
MQAYATSERLPLGNQLLTLDRTLGRTAAMSTITGIPQG